MGKDVELMMKNYCVDKAFLSSKALDLRLGATDATIEEGETKKVMMQSSRQVFFLYDHTKLDTSGFYHVAEVPDVENLIVDAKESLGRADLKFLEHCRKAGIEVWHAPAQSREAED